MIGARTLALAAGLLTAAVSGAAAADQSALTPNLAISAPVLRFDWPGVEVGVATYEEGPTGLTVIRFPKQATAVVDVRGGAPGTVDTDALRLGYKDPFVDAIVFSGGSSYGLAAVAAVMPALKDDGERGGKWDNIAFSAGAIIYDFAGHRLNEVYPDARLAVEALHHVQPGVFPLGAQGAGRMAMQGSVFGCGAHSGQGGAFRQLGDTKIAVFVVVNAAGSVVRRDGALASCHSAAKGPLAAERLLAERAEHLTEEARHGLTSNTTISLVVTNRKMSPDELQRLAVQVHTSMARAIQPFSTSVDGDTLFAASTQEVGGEDAKPSVGGIELVAAEMMWDAVLSSVPTPDPVGPLTEIALPLDRLKPLEGRYRMGDHAVLDVALAGGVLTARLEGTPFFDLNATAVSLGAVGPLDFRIPGSRYGTALAFTTDGQGRGVGLTVNPGHWGQRGTRIPP
jgi:L-aminopeptidase/D-esterase-like protein